MLRRSTTSSMRVSPNIGRSGRCLAVSESTLAPGPRGFTSASQVKANCVGLRSFISLTRFNAYLPLYTVQAFSASWRLLCPLLTPTVRSETIACLSVPFGIWPDRTPRRPPGVSPCAVGAQPLDLRFGSLMDMDFVLSCALLRPERLLSSCCSSARTCAPHCLQTPPRDGCPCASLAFTSIRLAEGLAPSECMNMPGTHELPRSTLRGIGRTRILNGHEASFGESHPARD
jgi:hypothetical protein